jgi:hypothetical protein
LIKCIIFKPAFFIFLFHKGRECPKSVAARKIPAQKYIPTYYTMNLITTLAKITVY